MATEKKNGHQATKIKNPIMRSHELGLYYGAKEALRDVLLEVAPYKITPKGKTNTADKRPSPP